MDDASPKNLKALEEAANIFISKNEIDEQLNEITTKLLAYK